MTDIEFHTAVVCEGCNAILVRPRPGLDIERLRVVPCNGACQSYSNFASEDANGNIVEWHQLSLDID